jgi:hypothetical protein
MEHPGLSGVGETPVWSSGQPSLASTATDGGACTV